MKIAINKCFGGFSLSEAAYEKLIEWGMPVRAYIEQPRNPKTGLYEHVPENDGEVIFDRDLSAPGEISATMRRLSGRYWETWIRSDKSRAHPLLIRAIEELGDRASGRCAKLAVVEVPDDIEWTIEEYDGMEHVAEVHRTWG
jgi:hypothetical protein